MAGNVTTLKTSLIYNFDDFSFGSFTKGQISFIRFFTNCLGVLSFISWFYFWIVMCDEKKDSVKGLLSSFLSGLVGGLTSLLYYPNPNTNVIVCLLLSEVVLGTFSAAWLCSSGYFLGQQCAVKPNLLKYLIIFIIIGLIIYTYST